MSPAEFVSLLMLWVLGTVTSLIITGFITNRFVIKKIMENPKVKHYLEVIDKLADHAEKIVKNLENKEE